MVQWVDKVSGRRARLEVESIFGGVRYKKREAIAPLKYTQPMIAFTFAFLGECAGNAITNSRSAN
jgi:hypothetical protein